MAQFAGGFIRFTVKDTAGNRKASTPWTDYTIADNAAAPRLVLSDSIEGTAQGTSDDQVVTSPSGLYADGSLGETLDVEFQHTAAVTPDTSAFVVALNLVDIYRDHLGNLHVEDRIGSLGARTTTTQNPNGLVDDTPTVANVPSAILRYIPPYGHRYGMRGHQKITVDGV